MAVITFDLASDVPAPDVPSPPLSPTFSTPSDDIFQAQPQVVQPVDAVIQPVDVTYIFQSVPELLPKHSEISVNEPVAELLADAVYLAILSS